MLRVYTASKITTADFWRKLHADWPHVYFHARWLKHNAIGTTPSRENAVKFWVEDEEDIKKADVLMIWGKPGEHLRGALVEAGIAIASGIPVIVVGDHPDYGTWQWHPGVTHVDDFEQARILLKDWSER